MSTLLPTSTRVHDTENQNASQQHRRDAGTLFVLKSKGSWIHCGYHLTTSIVSPSLLSLPYALTFLGWKAGIFCLVIGAFVSFYSFNLMSLVLEHHAYLGNRHLLYRDMARDILGPRWGRYFVGPIQFAVCYNNEVLCALLGGQCMKAIYLLSNPNGNMKLYEFVVIFGCFMLMLAQMPSFHSLRHINLVSSVMCLSYSACATAASIYIGNSSNAPEKDYSLKGDTTNRLFGIFNAIPIIATTYGSGIIPEIQATLAPPVKGKMLKSLCVCFVVVLFSFFTVAISGYWAFGNQAEGLIFSSFVDNNKPLAPKWLIYMPNICTIAQLTANGVEYLQPTNVILEQIFGDPEIPEFSPRNVIPRLISRSLAVITATIIAAMLPFFGDMNSLIGAFGYMPLDFILPMIFFNMTFKPSKRSSIFWLNVIIVIAFSALAAMATISTVRQIRNEYAASNLNNSTRSREPKCFSTTSPSKRCRHSLCPQIKRLMDSLWLPLDNFNCVSITGKSSNGPEKDYSLIGDTTNRLFGIFNAIPIIANTYGSGIVPEIQAKLAPPVEGKMLKGLVAISGLWAFGYQAAGLIFSNFIDDYSKPLAPKWLIYLPNICTIAQLLANGVEYLQPTNVILEQIFGDPESTEFSPRNVIPRLVSRSFVVITATTIAAMLPFFGDMNSLIGAFCYMPLDFILPVIFFNLTFKPSKRSSIFWLNSTIAIVFSTLGAMAAVSTVRQIILDAKTYQLFANSK
ncbi:GABA transporter 1 [Glycine max]|nr:GABA transporter 1 [Glycine max]